MKRTDKLVLWCLARRCRFGYDVFHTVRDDYMQSESYLLGNIDNQSTESLRVCFVVLDAYPAIESQAVGGIGGIETRSWMLARSLAQEDKFEVSFLVRHSDPIRQSLYDGVRILPVYDRLTKIRESASRSVSRTTGFPWLQFGDFRLSLLWQLPLLAVCEPFRPRFHSSSDPPGPVRLYTEVEADIFVGFGVNVVTAAVIASAKSTGKKSVLFIASDIDLDERYTSDSDYVNIYHSPAKTCHYAVTEADEVVVQTEHQLELLQKNFGRSGAVIGNPIDLDEWDERLQTAELPAEIESLSDYVLWVGRSERNQKQPQLMPELARLCLEIPFLMIMNPGDEELEGEVKESAPENLTIIEKVPFPLMPAVYKRARLLVNTSDSEGFPNTFLQAAASGVPVATLNVASEFLGQSQIGVCAEGSLDRLAGIVKERYSQPEWEDRDAAREYLEQHHSLQSRVQQVADLPSMK